MPGGYHDGGDERTVVDAERQKTALREEAKAVGLILSADSEPGSPATQPPNVPAPE